MAHEWLTWDLMNMFDHWIVKDPQPPTNRLPLTTIIKVIEKPAYDELKAEIDKQENELRTLRDELTWARAENSNLREKNEHTLMGLIDTLKWIQANAGHELICGEAALPYCDRGCEYLIKTNEALSRLPKELMK